MKKLKNILLTNDDGIGAKGLRALEEMLRPFGKITVVAPKEAQSGMSSAVTITHPLRLFEHSQEERLIRYICTGTPVDCVKIAMNQLFTNNPPDLLASGINHGANTSSALLYSGTLGAAAEGVLYNIPSIGFSLATPHNPDADFSASIYFGRKIVEQYLLHPPISPVFISVNLPDIHLEQIRGIRLGRQGKGAWIKEFDKRIDPHGYPYYWLTGAYRNDEPDAMDTDQNLVDHDYVSVVPHQLDTTHYAEMERLRKIWNFA
ncbi:MAG: 5'/3'-nucleotidase SurE [Bacteroidetes bacterium]|nr:5'/3'-nucleotidase SurE [Bacteroidota bacterium]